MVDSAYVRNCVNEADFSGEIEQLKSQLTAKDSRITFYLDDDFYDQAKTFLIFLKEKTEKQLGLSGNKDRSESTEELTTWEQQKVRRNGFIKPANSSQQTTKTLFQKRELFQTVLCYAHNRVSHRGRQITEKWL